MTGFKTRLAILAGAFVACAPALHAQAPTRGDGVIVKSGVISPENETFSLRAVCYSRAFSFTIVNNRFKASELVDARLGSRTQPSVQSTAAFRLFPRA